MRYLIAPYQGVVAPQMTGVYFPLNPLDAFAAPCPSCINEETGDPLLDLYPVPSPPMTQFATVFGRDIPTELFAFARKIFSGSVFSRYFPENVRRLSPDTISRANILTSRRSRGENALGGPALYIARRLLFRHEARHVCRHAKWIRALGTTRRGLKILGESAGSLPPASLSLARSFQTCAPAVMRLYLSPATRTPRVRLREVQSM